MKKIQVDMFTVGLGAALLIQFARDKGAPVTILADGGVGPGHSPDEVWTKLHDAFEGFRADGRRPRIDLIVGTHYDGDHLKGLLRIVQDESIDIGEIWLPPLMNDAEEILDPLDAEGHLAGQLFGDETAEIVRAYLDGKAMQVEELAQLERAAVDILRERHESERSRDAAPLPNYRPDVAHPALRYDEALRGTLPRAAAVAAYRRYFESHEVEAAERTGSGLAHESASYDSRHLDAMAFPRHWRGDFRVSPGKPLNVAKLVDRPDRLRLVPAALASIRKSVASHAITATYLDDIVTALRQRSRQIRPECQFIRAGVPRRFVWTPSKNRFVCRQRGGETDLVLTLLGPSDELVEKYRSKLPVGSYLLALNSDAQPIHRESITVNNRLSYIFTLEMSGQRILVSGDAGCYGFREDDTDDAEYFDALLKPLAPLHVVQIAHHGGYNYDFYNALLASGFARQKARPLLLLSHAYRDKDRPSSAFRDFIARIRRERNEVSLLFTATPRTSRVKDYSELIHRVVPSGAIEHEGDVRLVYAKGRKRRWTVERHAIALVRRRMQAKRR